MHAEVRKYNEGHELSRKEICDLLASEIDNSLPEVDNMIWHSHPVWFLGGNQIVGYSRENPGIRLRFWNGADFEEPDLNIVCKKFKDVSVFFNNVSEISKSDLRRSIKKSREIQWDYKNIVKRKGRLERLK